MYEANEAEAARGPPLKICMVNSYFPPWRGGAETYVHELSRALAARGHEVTVLCTSDPLKPGTYDVEGVQVRRLQRLTRLYGTPIQAGLLRELHNCDADIFHANFPSPYLAFTVALTSFFRKIPAVITWHNDLPPVTSGARVLIETHNRLILPEYIRRYRKIIATSETYRKISPILLAQGSRVVVVNNGVDCERFRPDVDPSHVQARLGTKDRFVVLFVGALTRWHGYKGLGALLKAMKLAARSIPSILLLVVGDGDLRPQYERKAHELGLSGNVIFVGDAPDEELPAYYAASDVLVLPSEDMSEGFGLTLLEANASGRPCIGSNTGGIPEVICDGYNGFLAPPKDPETLARKVIDIASKTKTRQEMGRNGRRVALSHDWSIVARKTEYVYEAAIAQRRLLR
jgi:glycosyltransferase involved in cell wall biosynthesis